MLKKVDKPRKLAKITKDTPAHVVGMAVIEHIKDCNNCKDKIWKCMKNAKLK